ncbi:hypothetical protein [Paracoccus sp. ME4]|uniref:hypothetical protein n=1 Tax=Paracoccus sp. ME4 TaxID=3138066 RepID=UPI00398B21B3
MMDPLDMKACTATSRLDRFQAPIDTCEMGDPCAAGLNAYENPKLAGSRLVLDLIKAQKAGDVIAQPAAHARLTLAIVRIWQLDRSGLDAISALEDAGILIGQIPEQPASEAVRRLSALVHGFPQDTDKMVGMRRLLRDALEISIPGITRLIDQGWTLHDRDLRRHGFLDLMVEAYPGVWARRPSARKSPDRQGIYMASKAVAHGSRWQALRDEGWPIISTWIDESEVGATLDWPDLWDRCLSEVVSAEVCIVYMEPGEVLKGAWVEVGAALAAGVHVIGVGIDAFSIAKSGKIIMAGSLEEALDLARGIMDGNVLLRDGNP